MKKVIGLILMVGISFGLLTAPVLADQSETKEQRYERIKAYKQKKNTEHLEKINNPEKYKDQKPSAWSVEAERSGLAGIGRSFKGLFKNINLNANPMPFFKDQDKRHEARKAAR